MNALAGLDFKNPNNSCQSLRLLAELVRQGEVVLIEPPLMRDGVRHEYLTINMEKRK
jgi:hypothetical protein